MKLTSVEIHPAGSTNVCVLSFRDPGSANPYNVKAISGLDAEEIVAGYYGGSGTDRFRNLSLRKRDVGVRIGLNPRFDELESYSKLRDDLYKIIASSRTGVVQLQFKNGATVVCAVSGTINRLEAPHFERVQEVQIGIECIDPMLRALTPTIVPVVGLDPSDTVIQEDLSTAPHGFTFSMEVLADVASFAIGGTDPDWMFEVVPDGGFLDGDILHLSSEYNVKEVYLVRGATTIYLADKIATGSIWPMLFPGDNNFFIENPLSWAWSSISYYPTYWGV